MSNLGLTTTRKSGILRGNELIPWNRENPVADLDAVLEQLKQERERAEGELRQLEKVIAALSKVTTRNSGSSSNSGKRMKNRLSAAARERIAAAQRARWAKVREKTRTSS
jgi:hypothetical protein